MELFKFIFPFLFSRNWHTGRTELSPPKIILFLGMLSIVVLGILLAFVLQTPVAYSVI